LLLNTWLFFPGLVGLEFSKGSRWRRLMLVVLSMLLYYAGDEKVFDWHSVFGIVGVVVVVF
jgi:hypothetical protein